MESSQDFFPRIGKLVSSGPLASTSLRQGERKKQPNVQRGRTAVILRFSSSFLIRRDAPPLRARPRATHRCGGCGGRLPRLFSG